MKKWKNTVSLLLALAMCLTLTACGSSNSTAAPSATPAEATAEPAYVYASEFKPLIENSKDFISVRSYDDDGMYYSSWEKVGENIPEGAKPQYEGQYDVYETFLYHVDKDGRTTKLDNYKTVDAPQNDRGFREFTAGSDLGGICFTPDGFVTIEGVRVKIGDQATKEYTDVDTSGEYVRLVIFDEYNRSEDLFGYTMPGPNSSIVITFTVTGLTD